MGESIDAKDVEAVEEHQRQPYQRMGQQLACQRHTDAVARHAHQLWSVIELQLSTNGIGGDEKDKKHEDAWHHDCRQVGVVVGGGIADLV